MYSLQPILLVVSMDVSNIKICLDTSILATSNMAQRELFMLCLSWHTSVTHHYTTQLVDRSLKSRNIAIGVDHHE
jgi:hypothetical protein